MEQTAQMLLSAWQLPVRRYVHTVCCPLLIIELVLMLYSGSTENTQI